MYGNPTKVSSVDLGVSDGWIDNPKVASAGFCAKWEGGANY